MTTPLTSTGEVANFIDDNQFGFGQSVDKCGPEAVAVVWHATAPDVKNEYNSGQVHAMAQADYEKFIGPDNPNDHNGTSDATLYAMLGEHGFANEPLPLDLNQVKAEIENGYLVIIGITESSVHDLGLGGAIPYNWNVEGLTHVIVASGPGGAGEILCRDTANIGTNGVRPGPRRYDGNALKLVSATRVTPTWLKPAPPAPPTPPTPTPTPATDWLKQAQSALSSLSEALPHLKMA